MESRGVMQASEQDEDRKVMFEKAKSQRSGDDAHHEEDKGGCQKYDADRTQKLGWNGKCWRQNVFIWRQPSAICSLQVLSWQHDNERLAGALLFNYRLLTNIIVQLSSSYKPVQVL